jgi:hypothetical protein
MAPKTQRQRQRAAADVVDQTPDAVGTAEVSTAPAVQDFSSKAPRNNTVATMPTAGPRVSFDRGSQDGDVQPRSKTAGAFEPRGYTEQVSSLRERISPPARPGDLPLAVIDEYGFVLPFSATNPMDKVILAQIPGITFVYTERDYLMVKEHNDDMIRKQRFEETLQGSKLRMPPTSERHGFRNGREVVASFVDETMLNSAAAEQAFNQYSQ